MRRENILIIKLHSIVIYNAWASEEVNHWDEYEAKGARYGRVRR